MRNVLEHMLKVLLPVLLLIAASGCDRPKVIPEESLKGIIRDSYLVNAYVQSRPAVKVREDSLDIYRPVLRRYGYTMDDLQYTMENYARRKSSRMSDIVKAALSDLERESEFYNQRVAALDTIDARALRFAAREVRFDSAITAYSVADTVDLRVMMPVQQGRYDVKYNYLIDSLDKNINFRTTFVFIDSAGRRSPSSSSVNYMNYGRPQKFSVKLEAKQGDSLLRILFGNYPEKGLKRPHMRIDSLRVVYTPPLDVALDFMDMRTFRFNISFDADKYREIPQDSGARDPDPAGVIEKRGDNP